MSITDDAFEPDQKLAPQATSFGGAADVYDRGRPSYPVEAVEWLVPSGSTHVVDLGAGTGKLTRVLLARGLRVTAVEPSAGMRAQLIEAVPEAQVLPGSAERLPVDGESVDAVLAAQAWHWVDPARAVPEVARVLRPGGVLGLLWNIRDTSEPWLAALEGLMSEAKSESEIESDNPQVGEPFAPIERRDFHWVNEVPPSAVVDMVASRSYVITLPADARETLLASVRDLLDTHPDTAGRATVGVPYVTRCSRAVLLASPGSAAE